MQENETVKKETAGEDAEAVRAEEAAESEAAAGSGPEAAAESETPAEGGPEAPAEPGREETPKKSPEKLFTLKFTIPLEDYLEFYKVMSREGVVKGKKKMRLMGGIETGVAALMLVLMIIGKARTGTVPLVLCVAMLALGCYSLFYYRFFYEKALRKAVTKEYNKNPYLQNDIVLDIYPNKCVEHAGEERIETFWHKLREIKTSENEIMLMVEDKRALLIPKAVIPKHLDALERLIDEICVNYEKKRVEL